MPRSAAPQRRFLLARSPEDGPAELAALDARHALRVLRLAAGDRLIGLDGRGAAWPLVITGVAGGAVELARDGEPEREPRPGSPGAKVPWIEVRVAWPRAGRAEAMLERLAQLGVARVVPWVTERAGPHARELAGRKRERLERVLAEACKQCGRLWMPELGEIVTGLGETPTGLGETREPGLAAALLDPDAEHDLAAWIAENAPARVLLAIGPEGGLAPHETDALVAAGFARARVAPYVLRIETAAEAAVAVSVHAASASAAPASKSMRSRSDA